MTYPPGRERFRGGWTTYFLRDEGEGKIKIGKSRAATESDLLTAIRKRMTLTASSLTLLGTSNEPERALHDRWSAYRENGEWFRDEGDFATFIKLAFPPTSWIRIFPLGKVPRPLLDSQDWVNHSRARGCGRGQYRRFN